jgi:hypothetical protein
MNLQIRKEELKEKLSEIEANLKITEKELMVFFSHFLKLSKSLHWLHKEI